MPNGMTFCNIFLLVYLFLSQCLKQLQAPLKRQHQEGLPSQMQTALHLQEGPKKGQMQTALQLQAYLQKRPAGTRLHPPKRQKKGLMLVEKDKKKIIVYCIRY